MQNSIPQSVRLSVSAQFSLIHASGRPTSSRGTRGCHIAQILFREFVMDVGKGLPGSFHQGINRLLSPHLLQAQDIHLNAAQGLCNRGLPLRGIGDKLVRKTRIVGRDPQTFRDLCSIAPSRAVSSPLSVAGPSVPVASSATVLSSVASEHQSCNQPSNDSHCGSRTNLLFLSPLGSHENRPVQTSRGGKTLLSPVDRSRPKSH